MAATVRPDSLGREGKLRAMVSPRTQVPRAGGTPYRERSHGTHD
jgi:hypothetical protein